MILDTTFVIDLLNNQAEAIQFLKKLEETPLKTTSITAYEVHQSAREHEKVRVRQFFKCIPVLSFTYEDAEEAGRIARSLKQEGKTINAEDCMIASIALRENAPILTRNIKHFSRIQGLRVVKH